MKQGKKTFTDGVEIYEFSNDGTLVGDSDTAVPTEKAVKTYVDNIPAGLWEQESADTVQLSAADNVNFQEKEALNFVFELRTSDPGSPVTGQVWFRTDV